MTKFYSAAKWRLLDPLTPLWLTTILVAVLLVVVAV